MVGSYEHRVEPSTSIKGGYFLDQLIILLACQRRTSHHGVISSFASHRNFTDTIAMRAI